MARTRADSGVLDPSTEVVEPRARLGADASLDWDTIGREDARQNTTLKRMLARFALWTMAGQLALAHAVFLLYGVRHWTVHDGVMIAYLTENFAQVVAVVLVITRHLFPSRAAVP